ncbi:hypothetical protein KAH94_05700 [bacterium]|nr:hypothetical protein [bacterium]
MCKVFLFLLFTTTWSHCLRGQNDSIVKTLDELKALQLSRVNIHPRDMNIVQTLQRFFQGNLTKTEKKEINLLWSGLMVLKKEFFNVVKVIEQGPN